MSASKATEVSTKDLGACNKIKLELALSFSILNFEMINSHKNA